MFSYAEMVVKGEVKIAEKVGSVYMAGFEKRTQ